MHFRNPNQLQMFCRTLEWSLTGFYLAGKMTGNKLYFKLQAAVQQILNVASLFSGLWCGGRGLEVWFFLYFFFFFFLTEWVTNHICKCSSLNSSEWYRAMTALLFSIDLNRVHVTEKDATFKMWIAKWFYLKWYPYIRHKCKTSAASGYIVHTSYIYIS